MFLIVGLGNPGRQYSNTRHNIGFIAADHIISRYNFFASSSKFDSELASGIIEAHKILVAKPMTFMNLSGKAVLSICTYYKILPTNIIVIHDDIDLEIGQLKVKMSGGSGGHNGLKSIDHYIGNNYYRIRLGIGRPKETPIEIADYVLGQFKPEEQRKIYQIIEAITANLPILLNGKLEKFKEKISENIN